jgi:hypothetical protein
MATPRLKFSNDILGSQTFLTNELTNTPPNSQAHYSRITEYININRTNWLNNLKQERSAIERELYKVNYTLVQGHDRALFLKGQNFLSPKQVVIASRLKTTQAIIKKMQRFDEPLVNMLDIWGHRIIVSNLSSLDNISRILQELWETPSNSELLLRHGTLKFDWLRDYRKKVHAGLSDLTSMKYDEAVHINRRTQSNICELQIMTEDLYKRAFMNKNGDEAHKQFAARRTRRFKKDASLAKSASVG